MTDKATCNYFIPYVRQGLAARIKAVTGTGAPLQRAKLDVKLQLTARTMGASGAVDSAELPSQTVQLYGPGDILGFDRRIVARTHPQPDIGDFEPNYFPAIDFVDPDFAWRFTAEATGDEDRSPKLTPWITLVVLVAPGSQSQLAAEFDDNVQQERDLPRKILVNPTALPDLKEAAIWAHVHIAGAEDLSKEQLVAILRDEPGRAVCRLLCARRLAPKTRYSAFVVPTFKLGLLAGLGSELAGSAVDLAWDQSERVAQSTSSSSTPAKEGLQEGASRSGWILLPYYHRWDFGTGMRGDFEQLVRLLQKRSLVGLGIGTRPLDCSEAACELRLRSGASGADDPGALELELGLEGALQAVDTEYTSWGCDLLLLNMPESESIQDVRLAMRSVTSVAVSWRTPRPSSCSIDYGETKDYGKSSKDVTVKERHHLVLTGLDAGQTYHFRIRAEFVGWHTVQSPDGEFAMRSVPDFQTALAGLLNSPNTEDLRTKDAREEQQLPSVVPPVYGRWHFGKLKTDRALVDPEDQHTWIDSLNLDPRHRAAAGLGAEVIRKFQEPLMAAAWDQLGAIESANQILRHLQLGRDGSVSLHERLNQLKTEDFVRVTGPVHQRATLPKGHVAVGRTAADYLRKDTRLMSAALDPAFRRIAGPRRIVGKRQLRKLKAGQLHRTAIQRIVEGKLVAAGPAPQPLGTVGMSAISDRLLAAVGRAMVPRRQEADPTRVSPVEVSSARFHDKDIQALKLKDILLNKKPFEKVYGLSKDKQAQVTSISGLVINTVEGWLEAQSGKSDLPPAVEDGFLAELGRTIGHELDPNITFVARAKGRLRSVGELARRFSADAKGDPLDPIMWAPEFDRPMYEPLRDISHELLLPGVEKIPQNTIACLLSNTRFQESYLCGLNHEFAGELLWRGYPTDQRASYFRQFWDVSGYVPKEGELDSLISQWVRQQGVKSVKDLSSEKKHALLVADLDSALPLLINMLLTDSATTNVSELSSEYQDVIAALEDGQTEVLSSLNEIGIDKDEWLIRLVTEQQFREQLRDVKPLDNWRNDLGMNRNRPGEQLILAIRGELLRRYPNALIYAVDAKKDATGELVPDLPEHFSSGDGPELVAARSASRVLPMFRATLPPDLTFFGFPFAEGDARGDDVGLGKFFVLEEEVHEARFGLDESNGAPPDSLKSWDDLSWGHFGFGSDEASRHFGRYLDHPPCLDVAAGHTPAPEDSQGRDWNSPSSATRAWLTLQKPVRIAVHASTMLPERKAPSVSYWQPLADKARSYAQPTDLSGVATFDWQFYILNNSDLVNYNAADAEAHWKAHGIAEGRVGAACFSAAEYLLLHRDVRDRYGDQNYGAAHLHFEEHGRGEHRVGRVFLDPQVFNANFYRLRNADLAAYTDLAAAEHWVSHGVSEGREASLDFSSIEYLTRYPDLQRRYGGTNYIEAVRHYVEHGIDEGAAGRIAFDPVAYNSAYYAKENPDLALGDENFLKIHWLLYGIQEGRSACASYYGPAYLARYSDLKREYGTYNVHLLIHWVLNGQHEGRIGAK